MPISEAIDVLSILPDFFLILVWTQESIDWTCFAFWLELQRRRKRKEFALQDYKVLPFFSSTIQKICLCTKVLCRKMMSSEDFRRAPGLKITQYHFRYPSCVCIYIYIYIYELWDQYNCRQSQQTTTKRVFGHSPWSPARETSRATDIVQASG